MKKSFTLIELLIVVAIIGILAGVGIPMYQGYVADAKGAAWKSNENTVTKFIQTSLTRCHAGMSVIKLPGQSDLSCSASGVAMSNAFVNYFQASGMKNPYTGEPAPTTRTQCDYPQEEGGFDICYSPYGFRYYGQCRDCGWGTNRIWKDAIIPNTKL